jgi:hypothetical protein
MLLSGQKARCLHARVIEVVDCDIRGRRLREYNFMVTGIMLRGDTKARKANALEMSCR